MQGIQTLFSSQEKRCKNETYNNQLKSYLRPRRNIDESRKPSATANKKIARSDECHKTIHCESNPPQLAYKLHLCHIDRMDCFEKFQKFQMLQVLDHIYPHCRKNHNETSGIENFYSPDNHEICRSGNAHHFAHFFPLLRNTRNNQDDDNHRDYRQEVD